MDMIHLFRPEKLMVSREQKRQSTFNNSEIQFPVVHYNERVQHEGQTESLHLSTLRLLISDESFVKKNLQYTILTFIMSRCKHITLFNSQQTFC